MDVSERIKHYTESLPYPASLFLGGDGRMIGVWIMGNNYQVRSGYYGGYPAGYLKRIDALFPDKRKILHLFSGRIGAEAQGDTVDLDGSLNPTYVDDAQSLENVPVEDYDLILADPPYSVEDAEHYGPTMVKRNKVMRALGAKAAAGTHVVWLDQVLPMYRQGSVGADRSHWHGQEHQPPVPRGNHFREMRMIDTAQAKTLDIRVIPGSNSGSEYGGGSYV